MSEKRELGVCPYCHQQGLELVGDGLANTTCSICFAEIRQEDVWHHSGGPGGSCPRCGNTLEPADDERGFFAVCPDKKCGFVDIRDRELTVIQKGVLPEGVKKNDPESWEQIEEETDGDWMIDEEYEDDGNEGEDDTNDHRRATHDIANDPLFEDIMVSSTVGDKKKKK